MEKSGQRVRNILTLEERVRAIEAYDRRPMYTKVATQFNCSWEQIKNIIQNRKAIIDFYQATKESVPFVNPDKEIIRQRKITFLGECVYEYIQRAQFHTNADITEEIIRAKSNEFRELIEIEPFVSNKAWMNQFKSTYNISLSQRQINLTRTPPASLSLKDIMTYCTRNKPSVVVNEHLNNTMPNLYKLSTTMAVDTINKKTLEEIQLRRQRKIAFLEKALYEYIQRSQFHHKMKLDDEHLRKVATELRDMLKIENFYPSNQWFNHFKTHFNFSCTQATVVFTRTPPFSLDLKDILSYCSRMENKQSKDTKLIVKCLDMEKQQMSVLQQLRFKILNHAQNTTAEKSLDVDKCQQSVLQQLRLKILNQAQNTTANIKTIEIPDDDDDEEIDVKPNLDDIKIEPKDCESSDGENKEKVSKEREINEGNTNVQEDKEASSSNNQQRNKRKSRDGISNNIEPTAKIQKIDTIKEEYIEEQPLKSPGHWSEYSGDDEEDLPKHAKTYSDALRLLKPLEEFAMLEENYRAIGLISQLENIFKNNGQKK